MHTSPFVLVDHTVEVIASQGVGRDFKYHLPTENPKLAKRKEIEGFEYSPGEKAEKRLKGGMNSWQSAQ